MANKPHVPGLIKGLGVTLNTMVQTIKPKKLGGGAATVQYPHEKETPPLRARGVIALREGRGHRRLRANPQQRQPGNQQRHNKHR